MNNTQQSNLQFSAWEKFDDREKITGISYPGIYAISISEENISGTSFTVRKDIVYFGMTNSRTGLRGRLNAFNNSLRDKKGPGHGGAERFRFDFIDGNRLAQNLYVSVYSLECNTSSIARKDLETMGDVTRSEYVAFANYAELYGELPKYNDKRRSPKLKKTCSPQSDEIEIN